MSKYMPYPEEEHKARLICNDPQALAYAWIEAYAKNLTAMNTRDSDEDEADYDDPNPITMSELIETAKSHLDSDNYGNHIVRGGTFEGFSMDMTFWDKLAILLDQEIPTENRTSFFSCAC